MTTPTLAQAKEFFQSDIIISTISDDRISYWINDIELKGIVDEVQWGKLFFNGFMNLLGHFLLVYETNTVSYRGAVTSESTAQVSRSYDSYSGDNPMDYEYSMTKYGRIFSSLMSRLAASHGGFVAGCCQLPFWGYRGY